MQTFDNHAFKDANEVIEAINNGTIDPYTGQAWLSEMATKWNNTADIGSFGKGNPYLMNPAQEKTYNNLLSRYLSQNETLWQAQQLQALGLSNAGVLQTGGVHTASDQTNVALKESEMKYQYSSRLASSLIGMAGALGSAGIHGAAMGVVKGAAGQAASLAAHSARPLMKKYATYYY